MKLINKALYMLAQLATVLVVAPLVIMTLTMMAMIVGIVKGETFVFIMDTAFQYSFMSLFI